MKKLIPISTQRRILRDVTNSDKTINFNKLALVLDSLEYDTKHCIHKRKLYWFRSWVQMKNKEFNKKIYRKYPIDLDYFSCTLLIIEYMTIYFGIFIYIN